jgi:transposase
MSFIRKIKKGEQIYLAEVENCRVDGKVVQKHLRYIGREANGEKILSASISNIEVDEVKLFGPLLVLHFLAQEIGLSKLLGAYSNELLSLVYAHCLDYKSVNQMERWFERTDLNMILNIEKLIERRLLEALDSLENCNSEELQRTIFEAVRKRYKLTVKGVLYDVTNTYLYGKQCPLGKLGHDKEGVQGRPLIQVGLGVTEEEGVPLFHKTFDGNIHDARTLHDLISSFRGYKIRSGSIVYDRGIISGKNLKDLQELGWDTLCGLPIKGTLKELVQSIIVQERFVQLSNRIRLNKNVFYVVTVPHQIEDVKGTLAVCFNQEQQNSLRESRYDEIQNAKELLRQGKKIKEGLEKYFTASGELIKKKLAEEEQYDGYSCIFTTKRLTKEKIVHRYFDKDLVEKVFRTLKGIANLRPIRHWLYNRVIAHVFICYLSYLLLSLLKLRLKKLGISPEEALRQLDSMYKVYMKDSKKGFRISRTVTLTKNQESILRAVSPGLLKAV